MDGRGLDAHLTQMARDALRAIDRLYLQHYGKPVGDIVVHVRATMRKIGWPVTDEEVSDLAALISDGTRIGPEP